MNHRIIRLCIPTLIAWSISAAAEEWTFRQCVDYARTNNISLQQSRLVGETAGLSLEEAKAQWEPTLDFTTRHTVGNSPWKRERQEHIQRHHRIQCRLDSIRRWCP